MWSYAPPSSDDTPFTCRHRYSYGARLRDVGDSRDERVLDSLSGVVDGKWGSLHGLIGGVSLRQHLGPRGAVSENNNNKKRKGNKKK
jgi:hypothetical protein